MVLTSTQLPHGQSSPSAQPCAERDHETGPVTSYTLQSCPTYIKFNLLVGLDQFFERTDLSSKFYVSPRVDTRLFSKLLITSNIFFPAFASL